MKNQNFLTRLTLATLAIACLLAAATARAASHTWSGAVNGLFSNAGNWSAGGVPTLAETNTLIFPAGATRTTVTNDIGALKVAAFNLSGGNYIVRGRARSPFIPALHSSSCRARADRTPSNRR